MNKIPTEKENPFGFHKRYTVNKMSGEPVDKDAEYMVLRLDWGGDDKEHIKAGRVGAIAYANAVAHHLPEVAKDLILRYSDPSTPPLTSETDHARIYLEGGATARVSPNASPELINALETMVELAKKMPETDQPVPEEVMQWIKEMAKSSTPGPGSGRELDVTHGIRNGAIAMYKRDQATIADLYERLAFYEKLVQFDGDLLPAKPIDAQDWIDKAAEKERKGKDLHYGGYRQVALDIYNRMSERIANNAWEWIQKHTALQSRLSQTEAERDAFKKAFVLKLFEGKKEGKV